MRDLEIGETGSMFDSCVVIVRLDPGDCSRAKTHSSVSLGAGAGHHSIVLWSARLPGAGDQGQADRSSGHLVSSGASRGSVTSLLRLLVILVAGLGQLGVQCSEPVPHPTTTMCCTKLMVNRAALLILKGHLLDSPHMFGVLNGHLADKARFASDHVGVSSSPWLGSSYQCCGGALLDNAGHSCRQRTRAPLTGLSTRRNGG